MRKPSNASFWSSTTACAPAAPRGLTGPVFARISRCSPRSRGSSRCSRRHPYDSPEPRLTQKTLHSPSRQFILTMLRLSGVAPRLRRHTHRPRGPFERPVHIAERWHEIRIPYCVPRSRQASAASSEQNLCDSGVRRMADVQIGYAISSEEHLPNDIVRHARMAEEAGFTYALISDHYHPWVDAQAHSPFVWSVIGGIATATEHLRLGTGVTCPTVRIHPAIIAQAAATSAAMMPGRFFLGVGTGEALNEHITGDRWPETDVRQEMLEEAIEIMRLLWQGSNQSYHSGFYTVENARLYTLPEEPVEVMIAASGPSSAEMAGRPGDGLITTPADNKVIPAFAGAGGKGPRHGQMTVCWDEDQAAG